MEEALPQQKFATEGLAPMRRPDRLTRFFLGVVRWAERRNVAFARHGNPPVYDTATFPWAASLEKAYPEIRAEL